MLQHILHFKEYLISWKNEIHKNWDSMNSLLLKQQFSRGLNGAHVKRALGIDKLPLENYWHLWNWSKKKNASDDYYYQEEPLGSWKSNLVLKLVPLYLLEYAVWSLLDWFSFVLVKYDENPPLGGTLDDFCSFCRFRSLS